MPRPHACSQPLCSVLRIRKVPKVLSKCLCATDDFLSARRPRADKKESEQRAPEPYALGSSCACLFRLALACLKRPFPISTPAARQSRLDWVSLRNSVRRESGAGSSLPVVVSETRPANLSAPHHADTRATPPARPPAARHDLVAMAVHYRTLSREFASRESFSEIDPPGLRSRGSKVSEDALLLRRAYSAQNQHTLSLPRNYRNLRASACAGWSIAALLLLTLLISHSTSTAGSDGALRIPGLSFGGRRTEPLPLEPVPKGGVKSRVTIVSGFFQVDSGKKHSVAGERQLLGSLGALLMLGADSHPPQTTTGGSRTSCSPLSFQSSSSARRASEHSLASCGDQKYGVFF